MRFFKWINFRPTVTFNHAFFSKGATEQAPQFQQALATGFDMSGRLFRVFPIETNWMGLHINKLRHVINPSLGYSYQAKPTISADRLIGSTLKKSNLLTPSIEQKLQTKRLVKGAWESIDLARFVSKITYDVEGASGVGGEWGNLELDLETFPYAWLQLDADALINPHIGRFESINADLVASPGLSQRIGGTNISRTYDSSSDTMKDLPWALGIGWRYLRNRSTQMTLETEFDLGKKWRLGIFQALDIKRFVTETTSEGSQTVKKIYDFPEQEYRLTRDLHEWTVELIYNVDRAQGESILFLFRLKSFPEFPVQLERGYHRPKAGRNSPKL